MMLCGQLHGEERVYCRIQISPLLHLPAVVRRIIGSTFPLECQGGKKPLTSASLRYQFQPSLFESRDTKYTYSPTTPTFSISTFLIFPLVNSFHTELESITFCCDYCTILLFNKSRPNPK